MITSQMKNYWLLREHRWGLFEKGVHTLHIKAS